MSDFATAVLRDFVKKLVGIVFAWVGVHFVAIPAQDKAAVTNWAVLAATAGLMFVWSTVVHALETRRGNGQLAVASRALARILMLGIKARPTYPPTIQPPAPEPAVAPIHPVGPNGSPL